VIDRLERIMSYSGFDLSMNRDNDSWLILSTVYISLLLCGTAWKYLLVHMDRVQRALGGENRRVPWIEESQVSRPGRLMNGKLLENSGIP